MTGKTTSPLGRDSIKFAEKMKKYLGEMEFNLYAAEQTCPIPNQDCWMIDGENITNNSLCDGCPARDFFDETDIGDTGFFECKIQMIRRWIGDHIIQHDTEAPI